MSIWLRHIRAAAVAAVGLVLSAAVALGAEFKVGDLIEVAYLGEWRKATVVQTNQRGEVLAEYEFAGRANRKVFSPTDIRFQYEGSALAKGRMWSDTSGKFRIKAAVIAIGDTEVTLRKPDMSELKVPLASLSAGDQKFVESLIAKGGPTTTVAPEPPPTEQFQDPVSAGWVTIASAGADAITRVALQPDPIPDYMHSSREARHFHWRSSSTAWGPCCPSADPMRGFWPRWKAVTPTRARPCRPASCGFRSPSKRWRAGTYCPSTKSCSIITPAAAACSRITRKQWRATPGARASSRCGS